jgi:hypothetical protein
VLSVDEIRLLDQNILLVDELQNVAPYSSTGEIDDKSRILHSTHLAGGKSSHRGFPPRRV